MNKQQFLSELRARLQGLPEKEVAERMNFYSEIIDDKIEEGLSEEKAVSEIGSVEDISAQILSDIPLSKIAKEKIKPKRRLKAWEIVLLAVGSPIWLSLAVTAVAVILSLYAVLWSLVAVLWVVACAVAGCACGGVIGGAVLAFTPNALSGIALVGAGMACAGVSIFLFFGSNAATEGVIVLTKKIALGIKRSFVKKEEA